MSHETPGTMGENSRRDARATRVDEHSAAGRRSSAAQTGALSPFAWAIVGVLLGAVLLLGGNEIREQMADSTTATHGESQHVPSAGDGRLSAEPLLTPPDDGADATVLGGWRSEPFAP
jgi:hypothetical protein